MTPQVSDPIRPGANGPGTLFPFDLSLERARSLYAKGPGKQGFEIVIHFNTIKNLSFRFAPRRNVSGIIGKKQGPGPEKTGLGRKRKRARDREKRRKFPGEWRALRDPKSVFDLVPEIAEFKRLLDEAADPLELEKRPHLLPRACDHDHGGFPDVRLFFGVRMAVKTDLAEVRQSVLALRNEDIKKHAIGMAFLGLPETLRPIGSDQDRIAQRLEFLLDDLTDIILVIDDQDAFFIL